MSWQEALVWIVFIICLTITINNFLKRFMSDDEEEGQL